MPRTSRLGLLAVLLVGCAPASAPPPSTAPESVQAPPSTSRTSVLEGAALVLDVRGADEYAQGHLDNALLIPVAELPERLAEVEAAVGGDKTRKIVAYCGSGRRAGKAKELLEQHGFTNVVNGGGYNDLR